MPDATQGAADRATLPSLAGSALEYWVDAAQRTVLFWDVMRQRGNQYREHMAAPAPHVLAYEAELVFDGRTLDRPVNYLLARIVPPEGVTVDPAKRPFVVVDPRAGHGPGIGGFKADSEIGVALRAGHPCYFVGFLPDPMPGQTVPDILAAEARFLEKVASLHPHADGKPCVVGNCQAGWALMMLAAVRPELMGPIIVAGSPLSYWQGVRGKYPMRYTGGLLGGTWLDALLSDLGAGTFDGAWLVQNFENQNPANTLWTKQYDLWAKIDTEAPRYLGFERWWGGHVTLNAEEIQFIVDELFVGNRLGAGDIRLPDGTAIDLRNIRAPIVVFCSRGDNITPPQQALGWILDLYETTEEIAAFGQTIVYTVHETVGHLGIFVSAGVARKEHGEFSSNVDLIDALPPGLYEATFEPRGSAGAGEDLIAGDWIMRCENRTLDDIRALGGNDAADDRRFATAARVSEMNLALYRTFAAPFVRATASPAIASLARRMHPLRLSYELLSDANPFMLAVRRLAEAVAENRRPAAPDNAWLSLQAETSKRIEHGLDAFRERAEAIAERVFLTVYGSPALQSAMGLDPNADVPLRRVAKNPLHAQLQAIRITALRAAIGSGGLREATIRGIIYAGLERGSIDERGFAALQHARRTYSNLSLAEFKRIVREQYFMLKIDTEAALAAIPVMLPDDSEARATAFGIVRDVIAARGTPSETDRARLRRLEYLFGLGGTTAKPAREPAGEAPPKSAGEAPPEPVAGRKPRKRAVRGGDRRAPGIGLNG